METYIALLRGVNVGGRNRVVMADLRARCEASGLRDVRTYVQSGNLVFVSSRVAGSLEAQLERLISGAYDLSVPVLVRTAHVWASYVASNPFPAAAEERPSLLHLCLSKLPPKKTAVPVLRERAIGGERIESHGDALWIDFASGVGRSKITPSALDRLVGSSVTARNWNTVLKIAELAAKA
ncbi:MAG: DUF1697 domain-containing protein [Dehalococcoidia bacterium]